MGREWRGRSARVGSARLGAALVLVLALAAAGCSSSKSSSGTTASTVPNPTTMDELQALVVTEVPPGFVEQPPSNGDTGPTDLAKAVSEDGKPDAQQVLTLDGFQRAYERGWLEGPTSMRIGLYQFATSAGAQQYLSRWESEPGLQPGQFALPPLPADKIAGYAAAYTDKNGPEAGAAIFFAKGKFAGAINVSGSGTGSGLYQAAAIVVIKAQLAKI